MIRKVAGEVNSKLTLKLLFLWLVILIGVISFAVYRSQNFTLRYSLDYFTFTISDVIPVIFPIIAVLIYVVSFSEEIRNRFIVYTRLRRGILETLYIKLVANIILSCLFYFTLIFVVFIFAYYIEPQLGIATYDLEGYGLSPETAKEDASNR
ncbi:hypothetical protein, partial [Mycobacterium tuberculosis]|uniref:hypothetical protein n=1 Tax=Mycobacterium tuberculosis TaxID=1773 RepID=UPI001BE013A1